MHAPTDIAQVAHWSSSDDALHALVASSIRNGALDEPFVAAASRSAAQFPQPVLAALDAVRTDTLTASALLVRNLPIGPLPPTPAAPDAAVSKDRWTETLLLGCATRLGEPVGYLPEHNGDVVQNIVPIAATADRQVSTSSRVQLEFHTEAAFHPHRPKYLLLLCLRGDPAAATTLCMVDDVVASLDAATIDILFEPRFATGVDESYLGHRSTQLGEPIAVLTGSRTRPVFCFDGDLMQGLDPAARRALDAVRAATWDVQRSVVLEPGDLLVVDNDRAVHGRTPFTPRFDGTDRWLQRTFVVQDLAPSASDRRGRVIATRFDQ